MPTAMAGSMHWTWPSTPVYSVRHASRGPKRQAVFSDRVRVFGGSTNLTITAVWFNKGS
jgi:hypothetical protein